MIHCGFSFIAISPTVLCPRFHMALALISLLLISQCCLSFLPADHLSPLGTAGRERQGRAVHTHTLIFPRSLTFPLNSSYSHPGKGFLTRWLLWSDYFRGLSNWSWSGYWVFFPDVPCQPLLRGPFLSPTRAPLTPFYAGDSPRPDTKPLSAQHSRL